MTREIALPRKNIADRSPISKFYDIIMIKRLNRIIIPTTIYMQVPENGNGGIVIGQSKA